MLNDWGDGSLSSHRVFSFSNCGTIVPIEGEAGETTLLARSHTYFKSPSVPGYGASGNPSSSVPRIPHNMAPLFGVRSLFSQTPLENVNVPFEGK